MKRVKIAALALCGMLMAGGVCAQEGNTIQAAGAKFEKFNAEKKYGDAYAALVEIETLATETDDAGALAQARSLMPVVAINAGVAAAGAKDYTMAKDYLGKAIETDMTYGDGRAANKAKDWMSKVYLYEGIGYFNDKNFTEAIAAFEKGKEYDPRNTDLSVNMAKCYGEMGNMDKAIEAYESILNIDDPHGRFVKPKADARKDLGTYITFAASESAKNKDLEALEKYAGISERDSLDTPEIYTLLVQAANNARNYDTVIGYSAKAAAAQSDAAARSNIYMLLGSAYDNKNNVEKAIEAYRKVVAGTNAAAAKKRIEELSK